MSEKVFSKETVEGQAREIGYVALHVGDQDFFDRYYSRLQSVDPQDIMGAAKSLFRPERATVGFLTREESAQPGEEAVRRLGKSVRKILVPEMNLGQMYHKVREAVGHDTEVTRLPKIGGIMHSPEDIVQALRE